MAKIRLDGFIEAFHSLTKALEETRDAAAPVYREAVEEWATETSKKAVVNLDRPNWLLSRSISQVVRKYDKTGKLWALAGVTKESSDKRDPAYYVRFHESGWRKGGGAPSAPKKFLARAKIATTPQLKAKVEASNKTILDIFRQKVEERKAKARGSGNG